MVVYLHGLNSAGSSGKAAVLRERLAPIEVHSPTYPAQSAAEAVDTLSGELGRLLQRVEPKTPRLLVGSSMGGFYGAWLARRLGFHHLVMINPALQPWALLRQVEGWQYNAAQDLRYYLSPEMVAATREYGMPPGEIGVPLTLLLDAGDELIDSQATADLCRGVANVHLFAGGSHGFDHMDNAVVIIGELHRSLERAMQARMP
jgi:uncharacterized protein